MATEYDLTSIDDDDLIVIMAIRADAKAYMQLLHEQRADWPPERLLLIEMHVDGFVDWVMHKHTTGETILPS